MRYKFVAIFLFGLIFSISISAFAATNSPCPTKKVKTITGGEEDKLNGIEVKVNIPLVTIPCEFKGENIYYVKDLNTFAAAMYKFLIGLAGIAAVIAMMVGGYLWLFSGGNASRVGEAKSIIGSAVFGLFLTIGSYMILNLINPDLVNWKFNPNIEQPTLANFANVRRICDDYDDSGKSERVKAIQQTYALKQSGIDINPMEDFKCGSIYYPNYVNYQIECQKGKEKTEKCIEAKKIAYDNGCMDIVCPAGAAEYVCSVQANKEGEFLNGLCVTSISAYNNSRNFKVENFSVANGEQIFDYCGNSEDLFSNSVGNACGDKGGYNGSPLDNNTCTLINESGAPPQYESTIKIPLVKDFAGGGISGMYKGKKGLPMGCRSDLRQLLKTSGSGGKW